MEPAGRGFLTGTVTQLGDGDFRTNAPRFQGGNLAADNDRYAPIRELAGRLGVSPGQLALAWLLHQHPAVVPIPGSRTPAHIDENLAAAQVELGEPVLEEITSLLAGTEAVGGALL